MPTKPPTFRALGWKPAAKRKQVQDPFYQSPLWKRLRARIWRVTAINARWPTARRRIEGAVAG